MRFVGRESAPESTQNERIVNVFNFTPAFSSNPSISEAQNLMKEYVDSSLLNNTVDPAYDNPSF